MNPTNTTSDVPVQTNENTPPSGNLSRRKLMAGMGMAGVAAALGSGLLGVGQRKVFGDTPAVVKDADILNFALNLEYLEAEFYLHATTGAGLPASEVTGVGKLGAVTGGKQVPFAVPAIQAYAESIADDEHKHVVDLRGLLGTLAVARPAIDIGMAFTTAAIAAGLISAGETFDVYANDDTFLLGAFVFEDVGVTAYHGAATSIKNPYILDAAAGILAVEAYHAGSIRTLLYGRGQSENPFLIVAANAISALRAAADGTKPDGHETPLVDGDGNPHIVAEDMDSAIAFDRTFNEVLRIVYLGKTTGGGGFFPQGLNGAIR